MTIGYKITIIYIYICKNLDTVLRLCLVRVKAFPKNIPFSGKENVFMCLVHFKIFFEKYFLVFGKEVGKEEGRGKTQKNLDKPRRTRRDLAINSAISDHD